MTGSAIALMLVAIVVVWGGLVAAIIALNVLPNAWDHEDTPGAPQPDPAP